MNLYIDQPEFLIKKVSIVKYGYYSSPSYKRKNVASNFPIKKQINDEANKKERRFYKIKYRIFYDDSIIYI